MLIGQKQMKTFNEFVLQESNYITEGLKLEIDEIKNLFSEIIIKNKPKNVSTPDHQLLKEIQNLLLTLSDNNFDKKILIFQITGKLNYVTMTKEEILATYGKKSDSNSKVVKKQYATYYKLDSVAYPTFIKNVDNMEDFLSTLSGFHKKAIHNLSIRFVDSSQQKSIGKYVTDHDAIQINSKRVGNTVESYGSLRYVVLHELGHRYLRLFNQKWDHDANSWITTKYSETDSFSGEEKFAELFALSHWPDKYPQYKEKIVKFNNTIQ
jgi:hypothetical protein